MAPIIVPSYAAIFALLFIFLSIRTIRLRRANKIPVGDNNKVLQKAIRAHANFSEYVPFSLLLLIFVEMMNYSWYLVHLLCIALLIGRISHAYGVSQVEEDYRFRIYGMAMTFTSIGISSFLILMKAIGIV